MLSERRVRPGKRSIALSQQIVATPSASRASAAVSSSPRRPPAIRTVTRQGSELADTPSDRWLSAFVRAFPYLLLEYCLVVGVCEWNTRGALIIAMVLGSICAGLLVFPSSLTTFFAPRQITYIEMIIGKRQDVLISLVSAAGSMGLWWIWRTQQLMVFSWLAVAGIIGALVLLYRAHYRAPHPLYPLTPPYSRNAHT